VTFRPEEMVVLSDAFDEATEALSIGLEHRAMRTLVAQLIVQAAREDKSLDAADLCRKAIAAFWKSAATLRAQ
jgi:hypothetical protein